MWYNSHKELAKEEGTMPAIQRVGVVGCGLMGSGITEVCARAGYTTMVREATGELLQSGLARINGSMEKAVARRQARRLTTRDNARARISSARRICTPSTNAI